VDLVRKNNDAYRQGDWEAWDANMDPDVFVRTDPNWPEQRIYGRDAFIAFPRGVRESLGPDVRIEEIIDLGDRVLVRLSWHARGAQSGVEGEQTFSELATFREGRVVFIEYFLEHEQALKAVGLEG
jgi:ketosteroid isomerase-like protein